MYFIAILSLLYGAYHCAGMFINLENPRVSYHAFRLYGALFVMYALAAWVI